MKKVILFFCSFLIMLFASGQTAYINGSTNSTIAICTNTTTTLTASILGGFQSGDTISWGQRINGIGATVEIAKDAYISVISVTVPRNPATPSIVVPTVFGTYYQYYLVVRRAGINYNAQIRINVNAAPTIGNVTFSSPCSDGTMTVNVDGLGPFPVNIKIYDDGTAPGNLITTQSVSTMSTSFTIQYWGTNNGDNSNLYIKVENPSTGCETWK